MGKKLVHRFLLVTYTAAQPNQQPIYLDMG